MTPDIPLDVHTLEDVIDWCVILKGNGGIVKCPDCPSDLFAMCHSFPSTFQLCYVIANIDQESGFFGSFRNFIGEILRRERETEDWD